VPAVLDTSPGTHRDLEPDRPTGTPRLMNEVVWLPAAVALLVCQTLILIHGLGARVAGDVQLVYMSSLGLVGASVLLMLMAVALRSHASGSLGLVTLALGVAADLYVATSAATRVQPDAMGIAFLSVVAWAMVWSITESRSRL